MPRPSKFKTFAVDCISLVFEGQLNTDGGSAMLDLKNIDNDYQFIGGDQRAVNRWLPWVHKFISKC